MKLLSIISEIRNAKSSSLGPNIRNLLEVIKAFGEKIKDLGGKSDVGLKKMNREEAETHYGAGSLSDREFYFTYRLIATLRGPKTKDVLQEMLWAEDKIKELEDIISKDPDITENYTEGPFLAGNTTTSIQEYYALFFDLEIYTKIHFDPT